MPQQDKEGDRLFTADWAAGLQHPWQRSPLWSFGTACERRNLPQSRCPDSGRIVKANRPAGRKG
jgi:hypothetical protein